MQTLGGWKTARGCTQALLDIELSRTGVATAVSLTADGGTGPRWLSTARGERKTLCQMGAGQELDLTEFRGPQVPASEAGCQPLFNGACLLEFTMARGGDN